jgi:hypothetical protein
LTYVFWHLALLLHLDFLNRLLIRLQGLLQFHPSLQLLYKAAFILFIWPRHDKCFGDRPLLLNSFDNSSLAFKLLFLHSFVCPLFAEKWIVLGRYFLIVVIDWLKVQRLRFSNRHRGVNDWGNWLELFVVHDHSSPLLGRLGWLPLWLLHRAPTFNQLVRGFSRCDRVTRNSFAY